MTAEARLAVLLSGRGSNFLAIHRAIERGEVPARVVLVASDMAAAPGILRARELGLPTREVPRAGFADREAHETALLGVLAEVAPDWICLAGYMRLLSPRFIAAYRQRILNIHPSLLPSFPGLAAQRQALEHGVRLSGCTVHLVDEGMDSGPIVVQRAVPVLDEDNPDSLAARILAEEHSAYPEALRRLVGRRWEIVGRRLRFLEGPATSAGDRRSGRGEEEVDGGS